MLNSIFNTLSNISVDDKSLPMRILKVSFALYKIGKQKHENAFNNLIHVTFF